MNADRDRVYAEVAAQHGVTPARLRRVVWGFRLAVLVALGAVYGSARYGLPHGLGVGVAVAAPVAFVGAYIYVVARR